MRGFLHYETKNVVVGNAGTSTSMEVYPEGNRKGITARAAAKLIVNKPPDSSKLISAHGRVVSDNAFVHANTAILGGSRRGRRGDCLAVDDPTGGLNARLTEVPHS